MILAVPVFWWAWYRRRSKYWRYILPSHDQNSNSSVLAHPRRDALLWPRMGPDPGCDGLPPEHHRNDSESCRGAAGRGGNKALGSPRAVMQSFSTATDELWENPTEGWDRAIQTLDLSPDKAARGRDYARQLYTVLSRLERVGGAGLPAFPTQTVHLFPGETPGESSHELPGKRTELDGTLHGARRAQEIVTKQPWATEKLLPVKIASHRNASHRNSIGRCGQRPGPG